MRENNALHVKLILANKEHHEVLKDEITKQLREHFKFEFELTIDAEIDDHTIKTTNSMIKRKIDNLRNKDGLIAL